MLNAIGNILLLLAVFGALMGADAIMGAWLIATGRRYRWTPLSEMMARSLAKPLEYVFSLATFAITAMLYLPKKVRIIDWREEAKKVGFALALLALLALLIVCFWAAYGPTLGLWVAGAGIVITIALGAAIMRGGPLPGEQHRRSYERR